MFCGWLSAEWAEMSYYALHQAIRDYPLPVHQKAVLWVLESYMTEQNKWAYPSQETIAKQCGMSLISTKRAIKALKDQDIIRYKLRFTGTKRVCWYQINRAKIESISVIPSDKSKVSFNDLKVSL